MKLLTLLLCLLALPAQAKTLWTIETPSAVYEFKEPLNYPDWSRLTGFLRMASEAEPYAQIVATADTTTWIRALVATEDEIYRGGLEDLAARADGRVIPARTIILGSIEHTPSSFYPLLRGTPWSWASIKTEKGTIYQIWAAFPRVNHVESVFLEGR